MEIKEFKREILRTVTETIRKPPTKLPSKPFKPPFTIPRKVEKYLLECPHCGNPTVKRLGVGYKSVPPGAKFRCGRCEKKFVVTWPFKSGGPEELYDWGVYYLPNGSKIYKTVDDYIQSTK